VSNKETLNEIACKDRIKRMVLYKRPKNSKCIFWDPGPPILCFFALHYSNSFQGKKRRVSFLDLFVVNQS
jgi:hypothetical protein